MESGKVSIIIPTYNHGKFIRDAVDSALAQTFKGREVLVIDDGSTDNTRELLLPYVGRIQYIYQHNRGLSAARNTGIQASSSEFIAILDADDIWLPEKLETQMKMFIGNPRVGLVSCGSVFMDVQGHHLEQANTKPITRFHNKMLLRGNCVSGGSCAVVRRSCFELVGVFDESLRAAEDWDMWLRIASRYEICFAPEALAQIRINGNSMSSALNAENMLTNELRVLTKHFCNTAVHESFYRKGMAYSTRYMAAAWAFYMVGNQQKARHFITMALYANPLHFLSRRGYCGLMIRIYLKLWFHAKPRAYKDS